MLPGFPKYVTITKTARGQYRIDRDDGYSIEIRSSSNGDWYQRSNMSRRESLSAFTFDMQNGYMAHDQILAKMEIDI